MSDFEGGFVIARVDDSVAEIVYRVVRDYLVRIDEEPAGRALVYATARDSKALWLQVTGGPSDGKGRMFWHDQHAALAGELAKALSCATWAWGREDQVGSELVVAFDASGRETANRRVSWDDDDVSDDDDELESPIDGLARHLLSWEGGEGASTTEQPLDAPFDPEVLSLYLLPFRQPKPSAAKGMVKMTVFLTRNVLDDATKLATATASDLGTVFWAAWELAKAGVAQKSASPSDGSILELTPGERPAGFASPKKKKPPALSGKNNSTAEMIDLFVPPHVASEMRKLAVHADVKYGRVVDYTYLNARDALWRGE